jgi:hypothetical protein
MRIAAVRAGARCCIGCAAKAASRRNADEADPRDRSVGDGAVDAQERPRLMRRCTPPRTATA